MANGLYSSVKKLKNRKNYEICAVVFVLISPFFLNYLISIQPERVFLLYSMLLISLGLSKICPDIVLGFFISGAVFFIFTLVAPFMNDISGWSLLPLVTSVLYFMLWSKKRYIPFGPLVSLQIFYFVLLLLGVLYTSMYQDAVTKVWKFSYYNFMPFICPILFLDNMKRLRNILISFWIGCAIYSLGGFFVYEDVTALKENETYRMAAFTGAIGFGRITAVTGIFILTFLFTNKVKGKLKAILILLIIWILYVMLLTGTRGALIAFLITVFTVGILHFKKRIISVKVFLLGVTIIIVFISTSYYLPKGIRDRLLSYNSYQEEFYVSKWDTNKLQTREFLYKEAWKMFKSSPLIGCGTSAFVEVSNYPHNIFLEIAVESGIMGLIVFSLFIFLNLKYAWVLLSNSKYSDFHRKIVLFLIGGFIFTFVEAQFSLDIIGNRLLWFFSGLIWTVYKDAITVQKKDSRINS